MKKLTILCSLFFFTACDQRPLTSAEVDSGNLDFYVVPVGPDLRGVPKDPCTRPKGGCFSKDDCDPGWECVGCESDPCCPNCRVCYGTCQPEESRRPCINSEDCDPGQYCELGPSCGFFLDPGECMQRPDDCMDPGGAFVCGCDGKTYVDQCHAQSQGVSVNHPGPCEDEACQNISCEVFEDCCTCTAVKQGYVPMPCPAYCDTEACDGRGIGDPTAYCLEGHCYLSDRFHICNTDADCYRVDSCCECAALPVGAAPASCPDMPCFNTSCVEQGVESAKARCVGGMCRLSLP